MIAYVTVGADDIAHAKRFYSAFLPALGYRLEEGPEGLSFVLPAQPGQSVALPDFYVKPTFNGHPASAGNGDLCFLGAQKVRGVDLLFFFRDPSLGHAFTIEGFVLSEEDLSPSLQLDTGVITHRAIFSRSLCYRSHWSHKSPFRSHIA